VANVTLVRVLPPDNDGRVQTFAEGDQHLKWRNFLALSARVMDCTVLCKGLGSADAKWFIDCAPNRMQCPETILTQPQFNGHGALTQRRQEVVVGVANGMTTKQIAASLGISFKTAECHRLRLMQKLRLHSTAAVVRYAVRCGLVEA
jgi:DNA-binding CsgD family transcriptional regulator